ncbi:unnamed protein product [Caenorhabditis sp. 36 PRJEB53466]|nr:unnamed protein product [Caenorhabditis sp. 36 PRJEB53466]
MQFRSLLLVAAALVAAASAMFDHGPKYGGSSHPFKPVYLPNPYGSKYESYGKYDDHKESHYQPSYYHDSYEPKYGGNDEKHGGADYYSSYQPSHQPYYGSSYYNEQPKYNDYHSSQHYYDKY